MVCTKIDTLLSVINNTCDLGLTEEQIIHIFSQVGQVLSFRLVYDKDTGRPKGYGFAEFSDAYEVHRKSLLFLRD